jgi:hypothetical protein
VGVGFATGRQIQELPLEDVHDREHGNADAAGPKGKQAGNSGRRVRAEGHAVSISTRIMSKTD